jgi:hypothetical protein
VAFSSRYPSKRCRPGALCYHYCPCFSQNTEATPFPLALGTYFQASPCSALRLSFTTLHFSIDFDFHFLAQLACSFQASLDPPTLLLRFYPATSRTKTLPIESLTILHDLAVSLSSLGVLITLGILWATVEKGKTVPHSPCGQEEIRCPCRHPTTLRGETKAVSFRFDKSHRYQRPPSQMHWSDTFYDIQ